MTQGFSPLGVPNRRSQRTLRNKGFFTAGVPTRTNRVRSSAEALPTMIKLGSWSMCLHIFFGDGLDGCRIRILELVFPAGERFCLPIDLLGAGCDAKIPISKDNPEVVR